MTPLRIAMVCFPSLGGSGIVATELAVALSKHGHRVRLIARARPERLDDVAHDVAFDAVTESDYPALDGSGAYPIALASKIVEVCRAEPIDVLHVHYAVPHATAAWLARQALGDRAPRIVTTLHGTDATIVGADPRYASIVRPSIEASDAVTVPSRALHDAARHALGLTCSIDVLPNFVDAARYAPHADRGALNATLPGLSPDDAILVHVSNFRPVKRVDDVVRIFASVARDRPARLALIGDGPDRAGVEALARELGVANRVAFLGRRRDVRGVLAAADVFLLPSSMEAFGLAALEAQSCGVPVVASDVGGVSEVVVHGDTGLLARASDVEAMAAHVRALLDDPQRRSEMGTRARARVLERFDEPRGVARYEELYRRITS